MNRHKRHITSFYMETLLLIAVFIAVILVLTQVFGMGRSESSEARLLTGAVTLAQNAAEAISASENEQELVQLLNENGNAALANGVVEAWYTPDMQPDADGDLSLEITWIPEVRENGTLVSSDITVKYRGADEPIYELETAVYLRGAGQ